MAGYFSRSLERLSSLKFTLLCLIGLILWLGLGVWLGQTQALTKPFVQMSQMLLIDWLLGPAWDAPLAPAWFLVLCLGVGLMLLNLAACTVTRLLPRLRANSRMKGWLLTLAHLVMLLVLLGHGAEMVMGHKREDVRLAPGQSVALPGGGDLKLAAVTFADDMAVLNYPYRQARWVMTSETFKTGNNHADVALTLADGATASGRLRIMEPLTMPGLRVTLTDFNRIGDGPAARVGVILAITHNPLTTMFFAAYAAWIAVYLLLAALTWRGGPMSCKQDLAGR